MKKWMQHMNIATLAMTVWWSAECVLASVETRVGGDQGGGPCIWVAATLCPPVQHAHDLQSATEWSCSSYGSSRGGSGYALANYGALLAHGTAWANVSNPTGVGFRTGVTARFSDELVVTGSRGEAIVRFLVGYEAVGDAVGATVVVSSNVIANPLHRIEFDLAPVLSGTFQFDLSIEYDVPFTFAMSLNTSTRIGPCISSGSHYRESEWNVVLLSAEVPGHSDALVSPLSCRSYLDEPQPGAFFEDENGDGIVLREYQPRR